MNRLIRGCRFQQTIIAVLALQAAGNGFWGALMDSSGGCEQHLNLMNELFTGMGCLPDLSF